MCGRASEDEHSSEFQVRVYICESRQGGVCLSSGSQSDPGRQKKILELWESGCRELSLHVRLIKFITWLSITNPWPFKIIQLLDSPSFHLNGAHNCSCQFSLMSDEAVFSVISPSAVPVSFCACIHMFTCSMYAHVCTAMHAHMYW